MGEKAKSVARGGEKRRLRGGKSNKNKGKVQKCCFRKEIWHDKEYRDRK